MAEKMIEIDGYYGEGGGQILRTAVALSAISQKPCRIFNIRKSRGNPGLALQHLVGLRALSQFCNGKLEGDNLGSQEIKFFPGNILSPSLKIDIETAGSITLVLQTLLLPCLLSSMISGQTPLSIKIKFHGGATDTFFSPSIDYFRYVFLGALKKIIEELPTKRGGGVDINISRRGFYPQGGAEVEVKISPPVISQKIITPLSLEKAGKLGRILIISGAADSLRERKVAERQISGTRQTPLFFKKADLPIEKKFEYYDTLSPGSQITIIAEFENTVLGVSNLGKSQKSSEEVGKEAAMEFLKETMKGAALDKHLCDQILPYIAFLAKTAKITASEITQHARTNIWVIEKFVKGKFKIEGKTILWEEG